MEMKPRLKILPGYKDRPIRLGSILVTPATTHEPPFPVQASVLEEDTWRLLSAPNVAVPQEEHPVRLMTDLVDDRPALPGKVLIQGARWLAIVHDVERTPTCREIWVHSALKRVLELTAQRHYRSLALPLLGSVYGCLDWRRSLTLIIETLNNAVVFEPTLRIWLLVPAAHRKEIRPTMEAAAR